MRLPAIADSDDDPLNRHIGEPLWADDHYGYGARLLEIQAAAEREGRTRDWFAMYQGRPRPPDGAMFKPDRMPVYEPNMLPSIVERVRAWDLASSAKGDFTVGLLLGRAYDDTLENRFIVLDVVRFRGLPEMVRATVKAVAAADSYDTKIWIPKDPAQAGADQADSYIRMPSGYGMKLNVFRRQGHRGRCSSKPSQYRPSRHASCAMECCLHRGTGHLSPGSITHRRGQRT